MGIICHEAIPSGRVGSRNAIMGRGRGNAPAIQNAQNYWHRRHHAIRFLKEYVLLGTIADFFSFVSKDCGRSGNGKFNMFANQALPFPHSTMVSYLWSRICI